MRKICDCNSLFDIIYFLGYAQFIFFSAKGLQTLFSLMGAKNMYEFHEGIKTGPDWSIERAEAILKNWERKFAEVSNIIFWKH